MAGPNPEPNHNFLKLLQYSGAGCLGITAAFIESLKSVNPELNFRLSWWTLLAFVAVSGGAWYVMERVFFRALRAGRPPPIKLVVGFTALLSIGTLAGFALSMRGISMEKPRDMLVGTSWAVLALSIVGFAFWKVVQFLERDAAKTNEDLHGPADGDRENKTGS